MSKLDQFFNKGCNPLYQAHSFIYSFTKSLYLPYYRSTASTKSSPQQGAI